MTQIAIQLVVHDPDAAAQFLDPSGRRPAIDQHLRYVPADESAEHVAAMLA